MSVLVTGGAGFIGSHIVERYLREGWNVSVLDDLSSGSRGNLPRDVDFHQHSITSNEAISLIEELRPQLLVHCAAQISVPVSMARPMDDLEINLLATSRLVSACNRSGVQRIVFISSGGAIYGETTVPASEETIPNPASYYGVHKLAAEYHIRLSGVSYSILRPSNVFGPRQRNDQEGGVVSIFVGSATQGAPITITGDGEQQRDFVYVDDVVEAVVRTGAAEVDGIWNVSTSTATSINQLADIVQSVAGSEVERVNIPARPGDVLYSCLDSSRLQRELGWSPGTSLSAGLEHMICQAVP